ncbi:MAG TPA: ABC transporter permease, partial [Solirubrobacter sp.]|nr:ABC transporter permease [Solirubrobacter sp.]
TEPAFGVVALARTDTGLADDVEVSVGSVEPGFIGSGLALEVRVGDPAGLPAGTVAVRRAFATSNGVEVGDGLDISVADTAWPARVVALYDNSPLDVDILTSWPDFVASGAPGQELLLIRRADGATAADATRALDQALEGEPSVEVTSQADRRESLTGALERRLAQFTVLFGVSIVIGVLGIVNALYMAVAERTAESALLRALGLPRRQLYATVIIEAELSAVVGAAIGVVFGLGLGWVAADELVDHYGHGNPVIPGATVAVYVGVAAVSAAVAALLPAYRAARTAPLQGMRDI